MPWPAVPAFLTPLSATLVHRRPAPPRLQPADARLVRDEGRARARARPALVVLYRRRRLCRRGRAMGWSIRSSTMPMIGASGAISAVIGAFALSFGRAQADRPHRRRSTAAINALWLLVAWVVLQMMIGLACRRAGLSAGDPGACRRVRRRAAAAAPAAAVAIPRRPRSASGRVDAVAVRLEQPVQVDDDIFHLGIVDRALGRAAPGLLGLGIAVVTGRRSRCALRSTKSRPRGSLTRPPNTR